MKVRVLQSLIYEGNAYDKNDELEILDIYVDNLITRKLVEEIKEETNNIENENISIDGKIDLTKLKVDELKKIAEGKSIEFDSKIKKEELIELINHGI